MNPLSIIWRALCKKCEIVCCVQAVFNHLFGIIPCTVHTLMDGWTQVTQFDLNNYVKKKKQTHGSTV